MEGEKLGVGAAGPQPVSLPAARTAKTKSSSIGSTISRSSSRTGRRIASGSRPASARIRPRGATSLYDAVARAVPLAQTGRHRKKAIVVISDGNDTNSRDDDPRDQDDDPLDGSAGVRDRDRHADRVAQLGRSTAAPDYPPPQGPRSRFRCHFRFPGASRPAAATAATLSAATVARQQHVARPARRSPERHGVARHHG